MSTITVTITSTDAERAKNALHNALHAFTEDIGQDASVETVVTATTEAGEVIWDTVTA